MAGTRHCFVLIWCCVCHGRRTCCKPAISAITNCNVHSHRDSSTDAYTPSIVDKYGYAHSDIDSRWNSDSNAKLYSNIDSNRESYANSNGHRHSNLNLHPDEYTASPSVTDTHSNFNA